MKTNQDMLLPMVQRSSVNDSMSDCAEQGSEERILPAKLPPLLGIW